MVIIYVFCNILCSFLFFPKTSFVFDTDTFSGTKTFCFFAAINLNKGREDIESFYRNLLFQVFSSVTLTSTFFDFNIFVREGAEQISNQNFYEKTNVVFFNVILKFVENKNKHNKSVQRNSIHVEIFYLI